MQAKEKYDDIKSSAIARLDYIEKKIINLKDELFLLRRNNKLMKKTLDENNKKLESLIKSEGNYQRFKKERQKIKEYVDEMANNLKKVL